MKLTDKITAPSRGSVDQVFAYAKSKGAARQDFLLEYLTELWRLCQKYGYDFSIAVAQSANETDEWRSAAWKTYGNPAGLNITNAANMSRAYQNGTEAARAHAVHLYAYNRGRIPESEELHDYIELSPSYANDRVFTTRDKSGSLMGGTVKTLGDFNVNGRWALLPNINAARADNPYGDRIIVNGNRIFGNVEQQPPVEPGGGDKPVAETITFGRVPKYGFTDRQAQVKNKPEGVGWDNLGQRKPKFLVLHRMIGSLVGTDGYFANPTVGALTDFGVGVAATDGAKAGHIYMWSDPLGFRSGWASGRVSAPYGDGKRIVDKYGVIAVNRDGVSVEISGNQTTPIDDVAWKEIVHLCAWWVDYLKIPYNTRVNPATGINYLIWHEEFTLGTGKQCPFDVVKALTNRLYNDIAAFLKPFQTGQIGEPEPEPEPEPIPEPEYAPPVPIEALVEFSDYEADSMRAVVTAEGHDFIFVNDIVKATKETPRLQRGDVNALRVGPVIKAGYDFEVTWLFEARSGDYFYLTPAWTRVIAADTERIKDVAGVA